MRFFLLCVLLIAMPVHFTQAVEKPTLKAESPASTLASVSATSSSPTVMVTTTTPAIQTATTGEVLQIAKLALDDAHTHTEHAVERIKSYGAIGAGAIALIAAILAFFGYREVKSITKPVRDYADTHKQDLDAAKQSFSDDLTAQKTANQKEITRLTNDFAERLDSAEKSFQEAKRQHLEAINEDLQTAKSDQQAAIRELTSKFVAQSEFNSKALVIAATIWEYVGKDELDDDEMKEAVRLVKSIIPDEQTTSLDPFLEGVLLIRMAFAQKRLGDFEGAFASAQRAVTLNGNDVKHFWLFNTACYAALAHKHEQCQQYVALAVAKDPAAKDKLAGDEDFDGVKDEAWFQQLLA